MRADRKERTDRKQDMTAFNENEKQKDLEIELLVIFAVLISLGFPGNFTEIYGDRVGVVMEYAAFLIEIAAMLLSSGKSWLDIHIVNLDRKYAALYLFVAVIFAESMAVTGYPSLQIITCARLVVTLLFAIWLQEQFRFERLIELVGLAQMVFVIFVLFFMLRYPGEAFESGSTYIDALRGLYPTKNSFATELVFGILVMAFLVYEKRKRWERYFIWTFFLTVQFVLLLMCQATGALFCLILVFSLFFVLSDRRVPIGWIYIAGNIIFLFTALTMMPAFEWFFEAIGKDATLTGRIPLWNQIIVVMLAHNTFTGFGYGMFWRDPKAVALIHAGFDENTFLGTMTTGAHNMLLEFWLNSGLIGITAFFAALLYSMRSIQTIAHEKYIFFSMIMGYLMINGFTERCLGGNYDYKMLVLFLVMACCCRDSAETDRVSGMTDGDKDTGEN